MLLSLLVAWIGTASGIVNHYQTLGVKESLSGQELRKVCVSKEIIANDRVKRAERILKNAGSQAKRQAQKSLNEAKQITNKDVAKALEGLPKNKLHCSNLGADALQMAIKDYEDRKSGKPRVETKEENEQDRHGKKCYCPYCDSEISEGETICQGCSLEV